MSSDLKIVEKPNVDIVDDPVIKDLLEVSLFNELKGDFVALHDLRDIFREKNFTKNSRLVHEGDLSDELYILTLGSVCITENQDRITNTI